MPHLNGTPGSALSPLADSQKRKWRALKEHLNEWYALPDLQCLRACAALYTSHFSNEAPIWMFVLAPPSTGKTEIMINPFVGLPYAHTISSITESAFISNYNEKAGILPNLDKYNGILSGALFFPDFSNFLALDPHVRGALQAQLREIYDGSYQKHCGIRKDPIAWRGKVSILAACTPELERYWGLENALGDRFLQCKITQPPHELYNEYLEKQQIYGKKKISAKTKHLMEEWLEDVNQVEEVAVPNRDFFKKIGDLTNVCISLRQSVSHNFKGEITDVGSRDGPARFMNMAFNLGKQHARLFGRDTMDHPEMTIIKRVLTDTCPSRRLRLCQVLLGSNEYLTSTEIFNSLNEQGSMQPLYRLIQDMEALRLLTSEWTNEPDDTDGKKDKRKKYTTLSPDFRSQLLNVGIQPITPVLKPA